MTDSTNTTAAVDDGGPAFPTMPFTEPGGDFCWPQNGASLRDYFAAKAMEGLIASDANSCKVSATAARQRALIAEASYDMADAMLKRRKA